MRSDWQLSGTVSPLCTVGESSGACGPDLVRANPARFATVVPADDAYPSRGSAVPMEARVLQSCPMPYGPSKPPQWYR
jgi:hypothetical protein